MKIEFRDWANSDDAGAFEFRQRIEAGEKGAKYNPWFAAQAAYEAGIREGKRIAIEKISKLIEGQ